MKRIVFLSLAVFSGVASAQAVDWDAAFASCSQEAAAFDRYAVETSMTWENQGRATWRHVRRNYTSSTIDVPSMRQAVQSNRSILSRGPNPVVALSVCVQQAALNQLQSGSTQGASTAPSRPAQSTASAASNGRNASSNMPEKNASHCFELVKGDPGALRNRCGERVNLRWCSLSDSNNRCGNNNLGWAEMAPGATTYVDANVRAHWFGCFAPAQPSDVEYAPGQGLKAYCKQ